MDVGEHFLSRDQTVLLRQEYVAGVCQLHYERSPLKIVRSLGQFLYDDTNCEYLDCTSRVNNVGYCHPTTVQAACQQMATLTIDNTASEKYSKQLLATLPSTFQTCLFTNSGAEANDLALQLAKNFTQRPGVVVVDGAFHGCSNSLIDISPKTFNKQSTGRKPWVHVIPCPDSYRGTLSSTDEYLHEAKSVIDAAAGQIGCFISEPMFVVYGMVVPPHGWLSEIYRLVRAAGGIVIADEIQTGMGRSGSHLWATEALGVVPDILTVGKPMGNGHPLAAVITSHRIAAGASHQYRCGPVEAAVGMSVLSVLRDERLLDNGARQGKRLKEKLTALMKTRRQIGDVRGLGLLLGVDIVSDTAGTPDAQLAEKVSYRLKEDGVLVANEGEFHNVLFVTPPLCVTEDDVEAIVLKLDKALGDIELAESQEVYNILNADSPTSERERQTDITNFQLPSFSSSDDSLDGPGFNYYDSLD